MLTAYQIEALQRRSEQLVDPIVEFLIEDIAKRISEAGQLTGTAAYQVWRVQKLGVSQRQLKKEIQKRLNVSMRDVEDLLTQAAETGYNFDVSRFPTRHAIPLAANSSLQQILNATVKMAQEDLLNMTQTIGFVGPDGVCRELTQAYQQACDFAFQKITTGAQDYISAIRDATRNLAEKGIRTIDYESGVHTSLEAAVRRNIMGGLGIMEAQISQQNHDSLGCDGWEISAHHGSAPDHEPYQGKQYPDAEYQRLNNSLVRPIGELNCGHSGFPIILGVNSPQYTPEELEQMRRENEDGVTFEGKHYTLYEATQQQRKMERRIRKQKRRILIDEATGDKDKLQNDQIRLQVQKQNYARFSKGVGLPTQHARMETAGFTWKHGKAAEKVAKNDREALSVFKLNGEYKRENGTFDFGQARADYENFLTSVPEKNRMYLQQSFGSVSYYEGDVYNRPFAYIPEDDAIWYDSSNATFWDYSFVEANTHELAHRIDNFFARSSDSEDFYVAIQNAKEIVNSNPQFFVDYCWESRNNFVSDIIDALSEGSLDLPAGHGREYWIGTNGNAHTKKEIFANMFSVESFANEVDLDFIRQNFPDLYSTYFKLL